MHIGARQPLVHLLVRLHAVLHRGLLLLVQDDLEDLAAVLALQDATADDLDGVDQVGHDGLVDGLEGTRTRALLLLAVSAAVGALGSGEDAAGCDDDDMAVRELLLQLTREAMKNWF
jgi:hypothetical protein